MNELKIYVRVPGCEPIRSHPTDAGLDLIASESYYSIGEQQPVLIDCGINVEIPEGYVGLLFARSSLATKRGMNLGNSVGVIDSDYRGPIKCAIKSLMGNNWVQKGERIAQLVVVPCLLQYATVETLEDLSQTDRGEKGFGSSGK